MIVLPQIQSHFHAASEEFPHDFTELVFRNEGFKPIPLVTATPVLHQELLETPSTEQGDWR